MGGSSGPLLGTFFLRAAATCAGKSERPPTWWLCSRPGVDGLQQRGKAKPGDKTMLDAWRPALDASALEEGERASEILGPGRGGR